MEKEKKPTPGPDDILRLRAEARALLSDPNRLPVLIAEFVGPDGTCAATRATVTIDGFPDRQYARLPGETRDDFQERINRDLPVRREDRSLWADRGGPGLGMYCISFCGSDHPAR